MRITTILILILLGYTTQAQDLSHTEEIRKFQDELNKEYSNPKKSPLSKEAIKKFEAHDFFEIDESFRIKAKFIRLETGNSFRMKTSTNRMPVYDKYAEAVFTFEGKQYRLTIYQSHQLRLMDEYKNHLFLPFTDLTNNESTYGGGRYIDLNIPTGDTIVIDFNKAYNPFCAYRDKYSCPVPPTENDIKLRVNAGIKLNKEH
ncbi:MAG: DUF1684 domain-containing protein [Flavobacteriaceae bacterium]|nr:DUF1684 domain-containing protein [Flavobacteriaceae bacterium]